MYFDTAYIAKCYLNEEDGIEVRQLARGADDLCSSSLCIAELACVFHRQIREGSMSAKEAVALRQLFLDDVENEVWTLIPVTDHLLRRVEAFTRTLPSTCYLRAGDAIHLVTATENGFREIWTNDRHLSAAAPCAGLKARSVR
jgi:predicted nucleic acid-binding protein